MLELNNYSDNAISVPATTYSMHYGNLIILALFLPLDARGKIFEILSCLKIYFGFLTLLGIDLLARIEYLGGQYSIQLFVERNKLGLSCAKLSTA